MTAISWISCIGTFLAALALGQDMPSATGQTIRNGLFIASGLTCPVIWRAPLLAAILDGRQRFMACVAMILALPLVLIPPM